MGPYARVDYNLTLCRLLHIYYGQPYARVDFIAHSWTKNLTLNHSFEKGICQRDGFFILIIFETSAANLNFFIFGFKLAKIFISELLLLFRYAECHLFRSLRGHKLLHITP
jgi:hypothetical protein